MTAFRKGKFSFNPLTRWVFWIKNPPIIGGGTMRRAIIAAFLCAAFSTYAHGKTDEAPRNGQLTQGNVQLNLKVGQTDKAQVLEAFGAPNITTRDASGFEVWSYQRHATVSKQSESGGFWTILIAGGSSRTSGFSQTTRTMTLIIKFDGNDKVVDFRSRTSDF